MSEEKSPDWLPAGWRMERKVRKNGKKDMCYSDPLNEHKFYSKPEVLRYLKKEQEISCSKSKEKNKEQEISCQQSKEKNEGTSKRIEVNVVTEKTVPEELPPGWIKELKVKKQGRKIRKDPYYTDPVTGYVFRSLKDVNRYLKTGVLGKLAFKPKDDNHVNMEFDDEKLTTEAAAEGEKSADGQTNGHITRNKSPKLVTRNDELLIESTDSTNPVRISENASEQCRENAALGDVNLPEASGSEAREEKSESTPQNELNGKKTIHSQKKKSSEKSKPILPRRASKRLAGVEVDLPQEPKTRRQAAARRTGGVETSITCLASSVEREVKVVITDISSNEKQVNTAVLPHASNFSNLGKHGGDLEMYDMPRETQGVNVEKDNKHGNTEADSKRSEKQELPLVLPPGSLPIPEEHGGSVKTDNKSSMKREAPVICGIEVETSNMRSVLPPAILSTEEHNKEVKTNNMPMEGQELPSLLPPVNLTTLDEHGGSKVAKGNIPNEKQELPIVSPPASLSTPEDYGKEVEKDIIIKLCEKQELPNVISPAIPEVSPGSMETDYKADIKPESPVNLSLTDLWTDPCIEFAVKTLTGAIPIGEENKVDTHSGSPLDMPLGELWTDPCIEFAVKTLTGAIPVGEDLSVQDYFQQHACSSENQGENGGFTLPDVGLNNFCQTEYLSQHFNTADNSLHKQQELVVPMLPNHRNGSLPHPGGAGLHQRVKGNNGECSRQTFF